MNLKNLLLTAAAAAALMSVSAPAFAGDDWDDEDDRPHISREHASHKFISRAQAKKAALARIGGRVTDIDFDRDDRRPHYDVEIVRRGQEYKVVVDARTGKVLSARRDD